MGLLLRKMYYPRLFSHCGRSVLFGRFIDFHNPGCISIGNHVVIGDRAVLDANRIPSIGDAIRLENQVFIGTSSVLMSCAHPIIVESGANISSHCLIASTLPVRVGSDTLLAAYCSIGGEQPSGCGKNLQPEKDEKSQLNLGPVNIGSGCWLGVRVEIHKSVNIGDGSIVGAHAKVETDLPEYAIAIGRPAKPIRFRK